MGEGKYKGVRPLAVNGRGNVGSSGKFSWSLTATITKAIIMR